jgi:sec-independent protein translocase protein TatC
MEKIRYLHRPPQPDPKVMSFIEHLEELRHRLIIMFAAVAVLTVVGWFLEPRVLSLVSAPLIHAMERNHYPKAFQHLFVTSIYGAFTLRLKIAIVVGIMLAFPIILQQSWAFVSPALGGGFYRYGPYVVTAGIALFAGGAITAYEVMPLAINFFVGFGSHDITIIADASKYISFVILIVLVFGVTFELPLVLVLLSLFGIIDSSWLWRKRVVAFFVIFAAATIITPGADWISPLVLGAILYLLYLSSIVVARLAGH